MPTFTGEMSLRDLKRSWGRIRTQLYLILEFGLLLWYNIKFLSTDTKTFQIVPSIQWQPAGYLNLRILSWPGASHLGFPCLFRQNDIFCFFQREIAFWSSNNLKKKKRPFCWFQLESKAQWFSVDVQAAFIHITKGQSGLGNLWGREKPRTSHKVNHTLVFCQIWTLAVQPPTLLG